MLELQVEETKIFNEKTSKLLTIPPQKLRLEHSLASLSKWEAIWGTPFLSKTKKSPQQLISYVRCMSDEEIPDEVLAALTKEHYTKLNEYLTARHSATWFSDDGKSSVNGPIITSELIYYWMTAYQIPFECDRWPLRRLMNLIKIAQIKAEQADPNKKNRPRTQMLNERAALNAQRRAEYNSKG